MAKKSFKENNPVMQFITTQQETLEEQPAKSTKDATTEESVAKESVFEEAVQKVQIVEEITQTEALQENVIQTDDIQIESTIEEIAVLEDIGVVDGETGYASPCRLSN